MTQPQSSRGTSLFLASALSVLMPAAVAFAADPAEKVALGPAVPAEEASWQVMIDSFSQFAHAGYLVRLLLSLSLAVACSWIVALHPRRATRLNPLGDLEERKALIVLGVVGAVIAELSGTSQTLAFVIFGIGALLRFRTVLDNPKITGKAIMVVVIGLACGMGQWAMAVFVTAFSWTLIYWLDSHMSCRIKIRVGGRTDVHAAYGQVQEVLTARRVRAQSSAVYESKRQMVFLTHMPSHLDPEDLEAEIRAKVTGGQEARIEVRVM